MIYLFFLYTPKSKGNISAGYKLYPLDFEWWSFNCASPPNNLKYYVALCSIKCVCLCVCVDVDGNNPKVHLCWWQQWDAWKPWKNPKCSWFKVMIIHWFYLFAVLSWAEEPNVALCSQHWFNMGELLFARHKFSRAAFTRDLVLLPIVLYLVYFAAFSSLTPVSRGKQPSEESQSEGD